MFLGEDAKSIKLEGKIERIKIKQPKTKYSCKEGNQYNFSTLGFSINHVYAVYKKKLWGKVVQQIEMKIRLSFQNGINNFKADARGKWCKIYEISWVDIFSLYRTFSGKYTKKKCKIFVKVNNRIRVDQQKLLSSWKLLKTLKPNVGNPKQ